MKKFLLGAIGLIALGMAAPAVAADLPARPYSKAPVMIPVVYDWSGPYLGLNGGWGSSRNCWNATGLNGTIFGLEGCHDATGGVAGGQAGYRWQASSWVFGVEIQGDWANLKGSNVSLLAPAAAPFVNRSKIDAFGTFTGQVGYAFNTVLLYAKGGGAVVDERFNGFNPATGLLVDIAPNTNRWGAVAGAGIEYAFIPDWSAAVEYNHLFMGSSTLIFGSTTFGPTITRSDTVKQGVDLVTVRVNYRWGGPVIAKY